MNAKNKNPKVDFFFTKAKQWQQEFKKLRSIILDCGLTEELKWGKPCYTLQGNNIVLIHGFKEYCALLFFKGALLKDSRRILIQQTENVQAARQIRFRSVQEIVKLERVLKAYVREAVEAEKAGLKVALKKAFRALTPGRQRGYLLYFSSAKQSQTREARIEKNVKRILAGEGLD